MCDNDWNKCISGSTETHFENNKILQRRQRFNLCAVALFARSNDRIYELFQMISTNFLMRPRATFEFYDFSEWRCTKTLTIRLQFVVPQDHHWNTEIQSNIGWSLGQPNSPRQNSRANSDQTMSVVAIDDHVQPSFINFPTKECSTDPFFLSLSPC